MLNKPYYYTNHLFCILQMSVIFTAGKVDHKKNSHDFSMLQTGTLYANNQVIDLNYQRRQYMKKLIILAGTVLVYTMAVVPTVQATVIFEDPAIFHLGNPPNSGTYLYGNEVQPISNTHLEIVAQGNQPTMQNPLLSLRRFPTLPMRPSSPPVSNIPPPPEERRQQGELMFMNITWEHGAFQLGMPAL